MGPGKGHGDDQRAGASPICRQAEKDWVAQPGQEKLPEGIYGNLTLQYLKVYKRAGEGITSN